MLFWRIEYNFLKKVICHKLMQQLPLTVPIVDIRTGRKLARWCYRKTCQQRSNMKKINSDRLEENGVFLDHEELCKQSL